jgi:DMSO/TMAO reductase YedYZ heme-binding membrane subunit
MRLANGWPLVGVASALLVALQLALFASGGTEESGVRLAVRVSARASFALFLLAYLARPTRRLWPGPFTGWMLRNRRYLGVSFAVAHGLHGLDIALLGLLLGDGFEIEPATLYGGGLAYLLLAAMTLTSFDRSARWLGPRRWKLLHRAGIHYLWIIFAQNWTFSALQSAWYLPFALASWAALGVRVAAWRAGRRADSSAGAPAHASPV